MIHDKEIQDLLHAIAAKSLQLISHFQENPITASFFQQWIDLIVPLQQAMLILFKNPTNLFILLSTYWQEAMQLTQIQMNYWLEGKPMPMEDQRFKSDKWLHYPFFNMLSHHYLLAYQHLHDLLGKLENEDKQLIKRLQFFVRHYLDALSPAHFIHTNPDILIETLNTKGKNLLQGLFHFLSDLQENPNQLKISMSNKSDFILGKDLATTPGKVIFRNEMMELIQYSPQTPQVHAIPLLIIPPCINKYYILDLSPSNSLVRYLVEQGISVFIISWVNPDGRFAKKNLYHYIKEGPIAAIKVIKKQLQISKVNSLGFCIGGTLLALLLAYNKAKKKESIQSATFLTTMIDFSDPGELAVFIDKNQIKQLEESMCVSGYLDGKLMACFFNSLRPKDLVWSFFIKNYLQGKKPIPMDILFWNDDPSNMPATMHSQYLRWMYLNNKLATPNKLRLNRTPLDVSAIDVPTFFLSTQKDHIAPWKTTYLGFQFMGGPKRFVLAGSGHIVGIINPPTKNKYSYWINETEHFSAEDWLKQAQELPGSWWPEWLAWLKLQAGDLIPIDKRPSATYPPLMDAPGSYVFVK